MDNTAKKHTHKYLHFFVFNYSLYQKINNFIISAFLSITVKRIIQFTQRTERQPFPSEIECDAGNVAR